MTDREQELINVIQQLVDWKPVVELVCPEIGGLLLAMYRTEGVLERIEKENRNDILPEIK